MPNLDPYAVRLVGALITEGRAGARPFGVPIPVWQDALNRLQDDDLAVPTAILLRVPAILKSALSAHAVACGLSLNEAINRILAAACQ